VDAFRALELSGMARVDFPGEKGGKIYLKVNTIPDSRPSAYPKLWEAANSLPRSDRQID
jgi:D-alanine-D-alanine ligase-like ATP-grasp enzyme